MRHKTINTVQKNYPFFEEAFRFPKLGDSSGSSGLETSPPETSSVALDVSVPVFSFFPLILVLRVRPAGVGVDGPATG